MKLPRVLLALGHVLVLCGCVLLLFVAYQLWGTGLFQARAQANLADTFAQRLLDADIAPPSSQVSGTLSSSEPNSDAASAEPPSPANSSDLVAEPSAEAPEERYRIPDEELVTDSEPPFSGLPQDPLEAVLVESVFQPASFRSAASFFTQEVEENLSLVYPADGQPIARITIPSIDVDAIVVAGVGKEVLRKGPGHYGSTPLPGQPGNAGIAGHRTTYGAPFGRINELKVGDEIRLETMQGKFTYEVIPPPDADVLEYEAGHQIVFPHEVHVLDDYFDNRLTLTSCHPRYSSSRRIVVQAVLLGDPVVRLPRPGAASASAFPASLASEESLDAVSPEESSDGLADVSGPGETTAPGADGSVSASQQRSAPLASSEPDSAAADSDPLASAAAGERTSEREAAEASSGSLAADVEGFGGLDGDSGAVAPAVIWSLAAAAVWFTGAMWSSFWRRLPARGITLVVFLAVLFVAFTRIERVLPAY